MYDDRKPEEVVGSAQAMRGLVTRVWAEVHDHAAGATEFLDRDGRRNRDAFLAWFASQERFAEDRQAYSRLRAILTSVRYRESLHDERFMSRCPEGIEACGSLNDYMAAVFAMTPGFSRPKALGLIHQDFRSLLEWCKAWSLADDRLVRGEEETAPAASSAWTGKRSAAEISRSIQRMVPVMQRALQMIIEEEGHRLHNLPADAIEWQALEELRQLHAELGELLRAAETGRPLPDRLKRALASAGRTFRVSQRYGIVVRGLEVGALSIVPAYAFVKAMELLSGQPAPPESEAAISAAIIGGSYYLMGAAKDAEP